MGTMQNCLWQKPGSELDELAQTSSLAQACEPGNLLVTRGASLKM